MARRPIFLPASKFGPLYEEISLEFEWFSGFAPSQKRKSMRALHQAARDIGFAKILEVSTKSEHDLGQRLSAFRLDVELNGETSKIECVYQASKVFEKGGPFPEITYLKPIEAKRFFRDKKLGLITHFEFGGKRYENLPFHAFYDWLFLRALSNADAMRYLKKELPKLDGFSDIEFNPARSINTQARSMAIIATLIKRNKIYDCANDFDIFRDLLLNIEKKHNHQIRMNIA